MPDQQLAFAAIKAAACSGDPVAGHTHHFDRYPARFSPPFARAAIEVFSRPGDGVLDPVMGGGTSAVEAMAAGRRFVGCDINPLPGFLARAATTPLPTADGRAVVWRADALGPHSRRHHGDGAGRNGLTPGGTSRPTSGRCSVPPSTPRPISARFGSNEFARCTLLRASQWALDGRQVVPGTDVFHAAPLADAGTMTESTRALRFARSLMLQRASERGLDRYAWRMLSAVETLRADDGHWRAVEVIAAELVAKESISGRQAVHLFDLCCRTATDE